MGTRPPAQLIKRTNEWLEDLLEVRRISAHRVVERGNARRKVVQFYMTPVPNLNAVNIDVHLNLLRDFEDASLVFLRGFRLTGVAEEPRLISTKLIQGSIRLHNLEVGTYKLVVPMEPGLILLDDPTAFFNA